MKRGVFLRKTFGRLSLLLLLLVSWSPKSRLKNLHSFCSNESRHGELDFFMKDIQTKMRPALKPRNNASRNYLTAYLNSLWDGCGRR